MSFFNSIFLYQPYNTNIRLVPYHIFIDKRRNLTPKEVSESYDWNIVALLWKIKKSFESLPQNIGFEPISISGLK